MDEFGGVEQIPTLRANSLLDSLTPQKIIEDFASKEDCTAEITELIKTTSHSHLKKLQMVFLELRNFSMENLLELTQSKVRPHRYISTFLIFSKIKVLCRGASSCDKIEALYNTVFVVRFRDVDPAIRSMCVQFISEWAVECEALRRMEFLKYIGWALNDRSDMVRRRAIKAIVCVSKLSDEPRRSRKSGDYDARRHEVLAFLEKYKSRVLEMSEFDCNGNLQKDCRKAILAIYARKREMFTREQILRVIGLDDDVNGYKKRALEILCPETIWDLSVLHEIASLSSPRIFKNLRLGDSDVNSFILNIIEFVKRSSVCCNKDYLCFLDILRELPSGVDPRSFTTLLDTVKDNRENVRRVIQSLLCVSSFAEYPKATGELLDSICHTILASGHSTVRHLDEMENYCIEDFVLLLKKLESDFPMQVEEIVSDIKAQHPLAVIRSFDISDCVLDTSPPILKCYAALWRIAKGDFDWINKLRFSSELKHDPADAENKDNQSEGLLATGKNVQAANVKPEGYLELVDFLGFFCSASTTFPVTRATDVPSASKVVFDRLHDFIAENFYFEDQEACLYLFKLISAGVFLEHASLLFKHCTEEQLRYFIDTVGNVKHIALGFFDFITGERRLYQLAKPIASRIGKTLKMSQDRYLLAPLKKLVRRHDLLDSVLLHFVPLLDINECIVLESLAPKSKFKSLCLKRCKAIKPVKSEENITFI